MGMDSTLAGQVLDHLLRNVALSAPVATVYLGLHKDHPSVSGSEVTGGSYARQAISFARSGATLAGPVADITFPAPTADWGLVTHWAIHTAATGGTRRWVGVLPVTLNVTNGGVAVVVSAGALQLNLAGLD